MLVLRAAQFINAPDVIVECFSPVFIPNMPGIPAELPLSYRLRVPVIIFFAQLCNLIL